MSDSVLNRILSNDTKNQKEQTEQTNLLGDILSVQQDIFKLTKDEAKFAARDRQRDKRSGADRSPGAAVRRGSGGGKGKGDTKKTENNTFSNALKGVAGTLASVLGLKALTKALKMVRQDFLQKYLERKVY